MRKVLMVAVTVVGVSAMATGAFACGGMKTAGQGSGDSVAQAPMSTATQQTQIAGSKDK